MFDDSRFFIDVKKAHRETQQASVICYLMDLFELNEVEIPYEKLAKLEEIEISIRPLKDASGIKVVLL